MLVLVHIGYPRVARFGGAQLPKAEQRRRQRGAAVNHTSQRFSASSQIGGLKWELYTCTIAVSGTGLSWRAGCSGMHVCTCTGPGTGI